MRLKDILVVYLSQRIVVFPLHLYINTLLTRVLDRLFEWNLLKNKKIKGKEKYFKFFVEKEINDILLEIKIVYKNLNIKIFTIYKKNYINNISINHIEYIEDLNQSINCIINQFKKICKKYFTEKIPENLNFNPSNKIYKGLKCGEPTGEEIEFLSRCLIDKFN